MDAFTKKLFPQQILTSPATGPGVETVVAQLAVLDGSYVVVAKAMLWGPPHQSIHLRLVLGDDEDKMDFNPVTNNESVTLMVSGTFTGGGVGRMKKNPTNPYHHITLYGQAFTGNVTVQNIKLIALRVDNVEKK